MVLISRYLAGSGLLKSSPRQENRAGSFYISLEAWIAAIEQSTDKHHRIGSSVGAIGGFPAIRLSSFICGLIKCSPRVRTGQSPYYCQNVCHCRLALLPSTPALLCSRRFRRVQHRGSPSFHLCQRRSSRLGMPSVYCGVLRLVIRSGRVAGDYGRGM